MRTTGRAAALIGVLAVCATLQCAAANAGGAGLGFNIGPKMSLSAAQAEFPGAVLSSVQGKLDEVWTSARRSAGISDEQCQNVAEGWQTLSQGASGVYEKAIKVAPFLRTPWRRAQDEHRAYEQRMVEWRIQEAFFTIDSDLSGSITPREMRKALSSLGVQMSLGNIERMVSAVDEDGNQALDLKEWKKFVGNVMHDELDKGGSGRALELAKALGLDGTDKDGNLSFGKDRLSRLVDRVEAQQITDKAEMRALGLMDDELTEEQRLSKGYTATQHRRKEDIKSHKSGLSGNLSH